VNSFYLGTLRERERERGKKKRKTFEHNFLESPCLNSNSSHACLSVTPFPRGHGEPTPTLVLHLFSR
jgi:hypothetical protein